MEIIALIIALFFVGLTVVANCKILAKAEIGWGWLFVPIYGTYCTYKVADCTGLFWATLVLSIVTSLISVPVLNTIILIIMVILYFVYCKALAGAFGKGTGFAIGLFLLPPVFIWILGFGDAEHQATAAISPSRVSPQEWVCAECSVTNAGYRATCRNCGLAKPILYTSSSASFSSFSSNSIKDTWTCPECDTRNANTVRVCKGCGRTK